MARKRNPKLTAGHRKAWLAECKRRGLVDDRMTLQRQYQAAARLWATLSPAEQAAFLSKSKSRGNPRHRNPVTVARPQSREDAAAMCRAGVYSTWSPDTAKVVRLIKYMDRTKSRGALSRAFQKANEIIRRGTVSADVANDVGSTYVARTEQITGAPYGYASMDEYRREMARRQQIASKPKRRRRRNPAKLETSRGWSHRRGLPVWKKRTAHGWYSVGRQILGRGRYGDWMALVYDAEGRGPGKYLRADGAPQGSPVYPFASATAAMAAVDAVDRMGGAASVGAGRRNPARKRRSRK